MKTFAIATTERVIKLTMPDSFFWLFKKFVKISYEPSFNLINGNSIDIVVIDEFPND